MLTRRQFLTTAAIGSRRRRSSAGRPPSPPRADRRPALAVLDATATNTFARRHPGDVLRRRRGDADPRLQRRHLGPLVSEKGSSVAASVTPTTVSVHWHGSLVPGASTAARTNRSRPAPPGARRSRSGAGDTLVPHPHPRPDRRGRPCRSRRRAPRHRRPRRQRGLPTATGLNDCPRPPGQAPRCVRPRRLRPARRTDARLPRQHGDRQRRGAAGRPCPPASSGSAS